MRPKFLIIMAGGAGLRMESSLPKQFLELNGRSILERSIVNFIEEFPDINIITVLPKSQILYWKEYCNKNGFYHKQILVEGGITRFHSVRNALEKVPNGAVVAIHDGVRPLITRNLIYTLFKEAEKNKAVIPILPIVDTLKSLSRKNSEGYELIPDSYVDRDKVFSIQTPQIFYSELIKEAYCQAYNTCFTDDSSVLEAMGGIIKYIIGERTNIKITTPDDIIFAQAILSLGKF